MSKIKNGGLDQYGAEAFEQQQFETAGVEGVNSMSSCVVSTYNRRRHQTNGGRADISLQGRLL